MMQRADRRPEPTGVHRALYRLSAFLLFNRIVIRGTDLSRLSGSILFVALHRNGALDSVPYLPATPHAVYLLSAQLHRSALLRAVFPGIAVARQKDRERGIHTDGPDPLGMCVDHLRAGGRLFVLPEGTSTLGPRHLPFKPGAARIGAAVIAAGTALTIVPLAVHYERAWAWQSRAEVVVGQPIHFGAGSSVAQEKLSAVITECLEAIGVNVDSEEELRTRETLAFAATIGTGASYARSLKRLEGGVPHELSECLNTVQLTARWAGAWKFQELPLMPSSSLLREALELLVLLPIVGLMFVLNAPPLLLGTLASRWLPDDRNVVAFWRALVGIPAGVLWVIVMTLGLALSQGLWLSLVYLIVSAAGIRAVRRLKMRAVAVHNALFSPRIGPPMRELARHLAEYLRHA
jgi:1-acyl-sn-glycerol-3-phosphate acyltransferase